MSVVLDFHWKHKPASQHWNVCLVATQIKVATILKGLGIVQHQHQYINFFWTDSFLFSVVPKKKEKHHKAGSGQT